jgi:hypothetical protein
LPERGARRDDEATYGEEERRVKRPKLCEACQEAEIRRAVACWEREKEARSRGEEPVCSCPPLVCEHITAGLPKTELQTNNAPARLDADRTAKPKTRLVARVVSDPDGPVKTLVLPPANEIVHEDGTRTVLG